MIETLSGSITRAISEPSLHVKDNINFTLKGLDSIGEIHGNVFVVLENLSYVQQDVKKHITNITDGKAVFLSFDQYKAMRISEPVISTRATFLSNAHSSNPTATTLSGIDQGNPSEENQAIRGHSSYRSAEDGAQKKPSEVIGL
ncbi:hypothetical protein GCK32_012690, partial [Trichostrongylus colubriformis]